MNDNELSQRLNPEAKSAVVDKFDRLIAEAVAQATADDFNFDIIEIQCIKDEFITIDKRTREITYQAPFSGGSELGQIRVSIICDIIIPRNFNDLFKVNVVYTG